MNRLCKSSCAPLSAFTVLLLQDLSPCIATNHNLPASAICRSLHKRVGTEFGMLVLRCPIRSFLPLSLHRPIPFKCGRGKGSVSAFCSARSAQLTRDVGGRQCSYSLHGARAVVYIHVCLFACAAVCQLAWIRLAGMWVWLRMGSKHWLQVTVGTLYSGVSHSHRHGSPLWLGWLSRYICTQEGGSDEMIDH